MSAPYSCEIQVRWGDSDRNEHVNNVLYAEYAQEGRVRFFRDCIIAAGAQPAAMVVRKMSFDYIRPVTDQTGPVTAELEILHVGNSSFSLRQSLRDRHGNLCVEIEGVMVGFDPGTERSVPLSDRARELLLQYSAVEVAH
jgi:acyl-CoA thioester hydrolase